MTHPTEPSPATGPPTLPEVPDINQRLYRLSLRRVLRALNNLFHLRDEADEEGTINDIKRGIEFKGANLWALVFAIFIASIGLNTNSAAVI